MDSQTSCHMCTTIAVSSRLNLPYNRILSLLTLGAILDISMHILEGHSNSLGLLELWEHS